MNTRGRALVVAVMASAGLTTGCGAHETNGRLVTAAPLNAVELSIRLRPDETFLVGDVPICPKGGEVQVTSVDPLGGRLNITGFTTRPDPFANGGEMTGVERGTLEKNGLRRERRPELSQQCGKAEAYYEMVIEAKVANSDDNVTGYRIHYTSRDGENGTLDIHYQIHACVDLSVDPCAHDAPDLPPDTAPAES